MSRYLFLSCYVTLCSFGVLRSQSLFDEYDFRCEERRDQKIAAKLQLYEDKIKALENQIKSIDLKNQQGELVYSNYGKKLFRLCKNLGTLRKMSPCQTSVCVILVLSIYRFQIHFERMWLRPFRYKNFRSSNLSNSGFFSVNYWMH